MTNYKEILRLNQLGLNQIAIAQSCQCSRKTVRDVLNRAKNRNITWPLTETTESNLPQLLYPERRVFQSERRKPDFEKIEKELQRTGVTLKLLWHEYCTETRLNNELPLMYSQFCFHYQKHSQKNKATMHLSRRPGEQTEVDWAGKTLTLSDSETGENSIAYLFVGVLAYSQYTYAEAFLNMGQENWISAHVNMFQHFQGVTRILVCDNLKTGVIQADKYSTKLNKTYQELAEHYNTAILPARISAPKDKPNAEGAVGLATRWITATVRNKKFFTLQELNQELRFRLKEINSRPFQKREGSRLQVFLHEEKPFLAPLPSTPYELAQWKEAIVPFNYHISHDKMQYSVPHEYIRQTVEVKITKHTIEIFYENLRLCSHARLYGHSGQYSTTPAHMPEDHQSYLQWDANRFAEWAKKIGPHTETTVKSILASYKIEQQGYRSCMGLLKFADKYSIERLENACRRALCYTPNPSYKSIKNILVTGQDKLEPDSIVEKAPSSESNQYGYSRGASYYKGGKEHE